LLGLRKPPASWLDAHRSDLDGVGARGRQALSGLQIIPPGDDRIVTRRDGRRDGQVEVVLDKVARLPEARRMGSPVRLAVVLTDEDSGSDELNEDSVVMRYGVIPPTRR
jgi:hypothetical protein